MRRRQFFRVDCCDLHRAETLPEILADTLIVELRRSCMSLELLQSMVRRSECSHALSHIRAIALGIIACALLSNMSAFGQEQRSTASGDTTVGSSWLIE